MTVIEGWYFEPPPYVGLNKTQLRARLERAEAARDRLGNILLFAWFALWLWLFRDELLDGLGRLGEALGRG